MLTRLANHHRRLVFVIVGTLMLFGSFSYFTLPAQEDPKIAIRQAMIITQYRGLPPERVEKLITRPLEQAARRVPEIKDIKSSSLSGVSIIQITVEDRFHDLDPIWSTLRERITEAEGSLPDGAGTPEINDTFGDVSVVTTALTGDGYSIAEVQEMAVVVRDRLYAVDGVKNIDILGSVPELIEVRMDRARLAERGLSVDAISQALAAQNTIRPGGEMALGERSLLVVPTGDFDTVEDIEELLVSGPDGSEIALRDLADIVRTIADPAPRKAYLNDQQAIILAISMNDGVRVLDFGPAILARLEDIERVLPAGYAFQTVTYQAEQVSAAVFGLSINVLQTIVIVLGVVMILLGVRTGLIVGAIVPGVMLATIAIMGFIELPLERMSLATLVIALGLLVDNGIVMAEDFKRRISAGESRDAALVNSGRELAIPLLASTVSTIAFFLPLMLAQHAAGEYTRSVSIVIAISLSISWLMAMTVTPILCHQFLKLPEADDPIPFNERMFGPLNRSYRAVLGGVLRHRGLFLVGVLMALGLGVFGMSQASQRFFPDSDRSQIITYIDLPAGATAEATDKAIKAINASIGQASFDWLKSSVSYVGFGGPRFVLSLAPVDPAPNRAVIVSNVVSLEEMDGAIADLNAHFSQNHPEVMARVTRMFLGPSDTNVLEIEITGADMDFVYQAAERVEDLLAGVPQATGIRIDWETRVPRLDIVIDQAKARDAGVTTSDINMAIYGTVSGAPLGEYREGDDVLPILLYGPEDVRSDPSELESLIVFGASGASVALSQVASIRPVNAYSRIERKNLEFAVTIEGRSAIMNAEQMVPYIEEGLAEIAASMPIGHAAALTGIVTDSADGKAALAANVPLALALVTILLVGQFNSLRRATAVLATIPLIIIGVAMGLHLMRADFGFMPILGLLSLAGIIINNAIVLIDRIDLELKSGTSGMDAIINASVVRLRPIIMTTITTILGLMPLIIARDPLFYGMASIMAWGLAVGTVLTLGVVPVLFSILHGKALQTPIIYPAPVAAE
ncbi:MAG: efflux RND transporter permease subunit [Alphaproteobacteria bacterium]